MTRTIFLSIVASFFAVAPSALAGPILGKLKLALHNVCLHGQLCDYTDNHGEDRRIFSRVLGEKRDLYVYLPPGYDPAQQYPLIVYLHGIIEDEHIVASRELHCFDKAMAKGSCPPAIIAIPNGRYKPGHPPETRCIDDDFPGSSWWSRWDRGFCLESNWCNTRAGRFRDYVLEDVVPFVEARYPIRPEPQAHAVMGFSMAALGSYNIALKHKERFAVVAGILPPLNLRWVDCHGDFQGEFDPHCWGWRMELDKNETIAWWWLLRASLRRAFEPYFGWGPAGMAWLIDENPIDNLVRHDIRPGEVAMWVGYLDNDQFNVEAQVQSFLYVARQRGLEVTVDHRCYPIRRHALSTALQYIPAAVEWVGRQLGPYSPSR